MLGRALARGQQADRRGRSRQDRCHRHRQAGRRLLRHRHGRGQDQCRRRHADPADAGQDRGASRPRPTLPQYLREDFAAGGGDLFAFYSNADFKDSQLMIAYADQGGLALPETRVLPGRRPRTAATRRSATPTSPTSASSCRTPASRLPMPTSRPGRRARVRNAPGQGIAVADRAARPEEPVQLRQGRRRRQEVRRTSRGRSSSRRRAWASTASRCRSRSSSPRSTRW